MGFKQVLVFALVILSFNSCAYRFSRSTLPSHLKSINIQPINNKTYQSILADNLQEEIKKTFQKEASSLQQVNQNGHCELQIDLNTYSNKALNFTSSGDVSEYRTTLGVSVIFIDKIKDEVMYKNETLIGQGDYDISIGETESLHGQTRAVDQLKELIVSNLLSQW